MDQHVGGAPVAHAAGAAPPLPKRHGDPGAAATGGAGAKDGDSGTRGVARALRRRRHIAALATGTEGKGVESPGRTTSGMAGWVNVR